MILVKITRIIFNKLNFVFINSIDFTSHCLESSELNNVFNFVKKTFFRCFLVEKIGGCLIIALIW
jgi:hypothetical protein